MCGGLEDTGARVLESARLFCIHSTPYSVLRKIYPTLISTVRGSRVHARVVDSSPFLADAEAAWWPLGTGLQVQDVVLCTEYLGQHELAAKYGVLRTERTCPSTLSLYRVSDQQIWKRRDSSPSRNKLKSRAANTCDTGIVLYHVRFPPCRYLPCVGGGQQSRTNCRKLPKSIVRLQAIKNFGVFCSLHFKRNHRGERPQDHPVV